MTDTAPAAGDQAPAGDETPAGDQAPAGDGSEAGAGASVPRAVLEYVAKSIVEEPDAVMIEAEEGPGSITLRLQVSPSDMGRVIGRRGRVAQAIRAVVRAAGAREGVNATVDIID